MSITSYAQNFEDVMLWRALGHVKEGFYIDIGAQDPLIDSVSLAFYERGWGGIHVEPTPHYAELLRQQRPRDKVIQALVSEKSEILNFFEIPESGISTADPIIAAQHRQRGFHLREISVPSITLEEIFENCASKQIHWLKIDVEGFEKQVLSSWGRSLARPWIVVVESTLPLTQIETHDSWQKILFDLDYSHIYFDGLNRYYLSNQQPHLNPAFSCPPNVFDDFKLNGTANAPFHKLIEHRHQEYIHSLVAEYSEKNQSAAQEIAALTKTLENLKNKHEEYSRQSQRNYETIIQEHSKTEQEAVIKCKLSKELHKKEKNEILRLTIENERALCQRHLTEKNTLLRDFYVEQQKIKNLQHQLHESRAALAYECKKSSQIIEQTLRFDIEREKYAADQLLDFQKKLDHDKYQLKQKHVNAKKSLILKIKESQEALELSKHNFTLSRNKWEDKFLTLNEKILDLQCSHEILENKYSAAIASQEKHAILLSNSEFMRDKLKKLLSAEKKHNLINNKIIEKMQQDFSSMRSSLSWRLTSPLRTAYFFISKYISHFSKRFLTEKPKKNSSSVNESDNRLQGANNLTSARANSLAISNLEISSSEIARTLEKSSTNVLYEAFMSKSEQINETKDIFSKPSMLNTLLAQQDQIFIANAYQILLGREPDPEGLNYYLSRLRLGNSKIKVLKQIRFSNEGKIHSVEIPGLDICIRNYQRSNLPLIGWFFKKLYRLGPPATADFFSHGELNVNAELNTRLIQLELMLTGLHQLISQQSQSIVIDLGGTPNKCINVAAQNLHLKNLDELKHLSPRARDIYFRLKKATSGSSRGEA